MQNLTKTGYINRTSPGHTQITGTKHEHLGQLAMCLDMVCDDDGE